MPGAGRMLHRYIGACNVQTDIKEAVFLGANDELVAAGARTLPLAWLSMLSGDHCWCAPFRPLMFSAKMLRRRGFCSPAC